MKKLEDQIQQTRDLDIEQIKNGKIRVTIRIKLKGVTSRQVYDFLINLNQERFLQFHPKNHKKYKVLSRPSEGVIGTIVFLKEEYENGYVLSAKARIIEAIPGKRFVLKSISPWWQPCILSGAAESIDNGILVIWQLVAGFDLPILGYICNKIVSVFFLSKENIEAIHKHAKEEYKNLEKLLQNEK